MLNPAAPFRTALRERNLRLLLAGLAASQAGDWLYNLALVALVYDRTHSSLWIGLTTAARIVPEVVLGPIGGILADRVDRRRLMIGADAARATTMVGLAVVAATQAPIVLAPLLAALATAAGSAYPTCVVAVLPRLADDALLPAANAARIAITNVCIIAGPLFGAVLLFLGSPATAFAVNASTFLLGIATVVALPREALRRPAQADAGPPARIRSDLEAGWRALRACDDAVALVGADVIASAVYGALTVVLVLLADRLGLASAGYGYLLAGLGAGGLLASGLASRAAGAARPRGPLAAALLAIGVALTLLAVAGSLPTAVALVALVGAGSIVTEIVADTCLQRSLPADVFARAYGLVIPACIAGIVLGALLAPVAVAILGFGGTLAALGTGVVACAGLVAGPARRERKPELMPAAARGARARA